MAARDSSNTGRNVALVGGGALVLWLLLRGKGWGWGGGGDGTSVGAAGTSTGATMEVPSKPPSPPPPCKVVIRMRGIELDGAYTDLPTAVARCRLAGKADIRATGGAAVQTVVDIVNALKAAGVTVATTENVSKIIKHETTRKS